MEPTIMQLVCKIFNMRILYIIFILLFTNNVISQVIPIGTVIKGKRLPTLQSDNNQNQDNSSATLYGIIKINDSKLNIVENGFVILSATDPRIPDVLNARQVIVSAGISNFEITISDFASNVTYKYRAYAKNSKNEYAYSQVLNFTTFTNFCAVNPCKNAASCTSFAFGALCSCSIIFCGDCCAQPADSGCPGGGDQLCPISSQYEIAISTFTEKIKFYNSIIKTTNKNSLWDIKSASTIQNLNK